MVVERDLMLSFILSYLIGEMIRVIERDCKRWDWIGSDWIVKSDVVEWRYENTR